VLKENNKTLIVFGGFIFLSSYFSPFFFFEDQKLVLFIIVVVTIIVIIILASRLSFLPLPFFLSKNCRFWYRGFLHQSQLSPSIITFPLQELLPLPICLLLVGKFLATDRHLNVVLVDSKEVRTQKQKKIDFVVN
jgi:hypothetical protein